MAEKLKEGCMPGTYFACSVSGWVNSELYLEWFKFFIANIPLTHPVLLIEDGHASRRAQLPTFSHNALVATSRCIYKGVFKSLKSNYSKECQKYLATNPGRVITTEVIASILGKAWPLSFTPLNIMVGAFPLNPGEVTDRHLALSKGVYKQELSQAPAAYPLLPHLLHQLHLQFYLYRSPVSFTAEQHQLYQKR